MFDKLTIRQKLHLGFGVVIALMLMVLGYTYIDSQQVYYIMDSNRSIYEVLQELEGTLTNLIDTEMESSEYILTGDVRHLNAFNLNSEDFKIRYENLKKMLSLDRSQEGRMTKLINDYSIWLEYQKNIHKRIKSEGNNAENSKSNELYLTNLIIAGKSNDLMSGLRMIITDIYKDGHTYLMIGSEELKKYVERIRYTILIGGLCAALIGIVISFFASVSIIRPIRSLAYATQRVKEHNYQQIIEIKTSKDLGMLIDNFNDMQIIIQQREEELRKKNEAIKTQMVEISDANKLKSQFLANMSHELRTPLNSIIGFTTRVIKKCSDVLPPVQLENLRIVKEESNHLLDLINNLLDYSKVEAGKMQLHIETFDLTRVIGEVSNMAKTLIEGKPLKYEQDIFPGENLMINSDSMKIKQILINLISNAVKYSEEGIIRLSVKRIEEEYCIKLEDEGIGISQENIENIFDEFRQVDGSYTRKIGGTGLGLSITKKFTEMLGGRIEVNSIVGAGSSFFVYLPVSLEEDCPCDDNLEDKKNIEDCEHKRTIACVDDDPNVQRLYKQYLQEQGFVWHSFSGNENVVEKIAEIMPDAILLDIMLPKKDGWDILAELKANEKTSAIPVVIASVLNEKNLAYKMKADEYLVKPISQEELTECINKLIYKKEEAYDDKNTGN